jgi:hypothetical protein
VNVTYDYIPTCPPVTSLVRFGIHHQPTQLLLTFGGPLAPADANNPAFYQVIKPNSQGSFTGPGTTIVPIASASYNPANNTVLLTTAQQLNVHYINQLKISLPCTNGTPVVIEFGGKSSLGGFFYHGHHYTVVNGKVVPG